MGRALGFISLILALGIGAYLYMKQTRSVTSGGTANPVATVDLIGVKNDLMAIAQAERAHNAMHGNYVSIDDLRSSGELTMPRNNRDAYNYSADVSDSSFKVSATWSGTATAGVPHSISVDQSMQFTQE